MLETSGLCGVIVVSTLPVNPVLASTVLQMEGG
jgi:hypothetical protein